MNFIAHTSDRAMEETHTSDRAMEETHPSDRAMEEAHSKEGGQKLTPYIHTLNERNCSLHTTIYIHVYIPLHIHGYTSTYLHTYTSTYLHIYIPTYVHINIRLRSIYTLEAIHIRKPKDSL